MTAPAKRVHITTFGCQMNEYDSGRLAGMLADLGYQSVDEAKDADLILVNTCSVRQRAEHKVYSLVGALKELKQRRPGLIIGVGGCVAQQEGQKLLDQIPHLDLVFGTGALERLPELLEDAAQGRRRALTEMSGIIDARPRHAPRQAGLSALVTVMEGCDNFCTYCVVPYVRGRERSRSAAAVLAEVEALTQAGAREITLLGQNVNSYRDPQEGLDFADLLVLLCQAPQLWRLGFTTSHPKDLSPRLVETMASQDKVMHKLHLPAQAGSDRILKAMGRGYTRQEYLDKVAALRRLLPDVALGGDLIVGFPGETEDDFAQSLELLELARYDFLFSFKYSDRPFTKAGRLAEKLDEATKGRRLRLLQERQNQLALELHRGLEGRVEEVLVEGRAKKGAGMMSGRSRAGRAVNFAGSAELVGRLVKVRVTEGLVNSLRGELLPS